MVSSISLIGLYSTFSIKWGFDKMGTFGQNRLLFFHGKMGILRNENG